MAQNEYGQASFQVTITVEYFNVGTLSGGAITGIIFLVLILITFYALSMLHASKKLDLFQHCKKKPLSPEELARIKYINEIQLALDDVLPGVVDTSRGQLSMNGKEQDPNLTDSFFADDPYIGHK